MILEKRSGRLCSRISTISEFSLILEIREQQRLKEHFTRLPTYVTIISSTYILSYKLKS
ncbi:hypothetical protein D3C76_38770 [compost metagenome]